MLVNMSQLISMNLTKMKNYIIFSGIGNHKTFLSMLKKYNIKIYKDFEFQITINIQLKILIKL